MLLSSFCRILQKETGPPLRYPLYQNLCLVMKVKTNFDTDCTPRGLFVYTAEARFEKKKAMNAQLLAYRPYLSPEELTRHILAGIDTVGGSLPTEME